MGYQEQQTARVAALYRAHGMVPRWERVWHEGRDVTADPPETWGPPWSWYVAGRRGAAARNYWLQQHADAIAEHRDDADPRR